MDVKNSDSKDLLEVNESAQDETFPTPSPPPPSYTSSMQSSTMHVYFSNWTGSKIRVMADDKTTQLYGIETHLRKPNMIFHKHTDVEASRPIANIVFHTFSTKIDAKFLESKASCTMKADSWKKQNSFSYESPVLGGGTHLTWKGSVGNYTELVCLDDKAMPIARFKASNWSVKKAGRMEFMDDTSISLTPEIVDEIVVMGLSMLKYRIEETTAIATSVS